MSLKSVLLLSLCLIMQARAHAQNCTTTADCADLDGNAVRDDVCTWWDCAGGTCVSADVQYGDVKGPGSACLPDGLVNLNDFSWGTLSCFRNVNPGGAGQNPCEDDAPRAMNIDVGGRYQTCAPDGVCDMNDYFAGQAAAAGESACTCPAPGGAAPGASAARPQRAAAGSGPAAVRVFMALDGQQSHVPTSGNTAIMMPPGQMAHVTVWMQDASASATLLHAYQLVLEDQAQPFAGATGSVSYANQSPWEDITIDMERKDWVIAPAELILPADYPTHSAELDLFGTIYTCVMGISVVPSLLNKPWYLAEFDLEASDDASGFFELRFVREPIPEHPRPLADLFQDSGAEYAVGEFQNLTILVGCDSFHDCADLNFDGIRDDPCLWWACTAGACVPTHRDAAQADLGGPFGDCPVDGACDANDRFHAINCFGNQATDGAIYPCEPNSPQALNVDAVGLTGTCQLDGVCDINDAFAALNCFADQGTQGGPFPCTCAATPQPDPPAFTRPVPLAQAALSVRGPRHARAGDVVEFDVYLDTAVASLQGYQLHLRASGGRRGALELVDVVVHDQHGDDVFAGLDTWSAFNTATGQMLRGLDAPAALNQGGRYLATFVYRASAQAEGQFVVEVLHDERLLIPRQRTFLFASPGEPIGIADVQMGRIQVDRHR